MDFFIKHPENILISELFALGRDLNEVRVNVKLSNC